MGQPHATIGESALLRCLLVAAALVVVQAAVLLAMGQPAICACGTVRLWTGVVNGPENSQQLADWYSLSHVVHGLGFYLLLWLVFPRAPVMLRFLLAVGLECAWEIVENTPVVIERYRQQALAQGYAGDSVINSVSDTLMMMAGFAFARAAPAWAGIVLALALEAFSGVMIRDNLTLNIIQLIHPSETISRWQAGG